MNNPLLLAVNAYDIDSQKEGELPPNLLFPA